MKSLAIVKTNEHSRGKKKNLIGSKTDHHSSNSKEIERNVAILEDINLPIIYWYYYL